MRFLIALLLLTGLATAQTEGRRDEVLGAFIPIAAAMDTEQPELVLELVDELRAKGPVPDDLDLELCLAAAEASRQAGLPARMREFLERARTLAARSESVTVLVLVDSYAFEDLRRTDPERARKELFPRLDAVLTRLQGYRPSLAERSSGTLLLPQLGRVYAIWLEALLRRADESPAEVKARLERTLQLAGAAARAWARPEGQDPTTVRPQVWLAFCEARVAAARRLSPADPLLPLLDPSQDLEELEALVQGLARSSGLEVPEAAIAMIVGSGRARVQLQQVRSICRAAAGRKFTSDEATRVRGLLQSATAVVKERASVALANDLYVTGAAAFFHSNNPQWQSSADKILNSLPPSVEKSRPDLIRALTLRGRLRGLQGRKPEALADATRAVGLIEDLIRETGGSPAASEQIREEARETYELLTRLQLDAGQDAGAFQTVSRYQQLESASLFRVDDLARGSGLAQAQERLYSLERQAAQSPERAGKFEQVRRQVQADYQKLSAAHAPLNRLALQAPDLPALQRKLPPDAALVQLFSGEEQLYVFVVRRDQLAIHKVATTRSELEALVARTRRKLARPAPAFAWDSDAGRDLAASL
ncbi:MAG: hypothetical protein AB1758_29970, partial [Candidatus Eremiobacterota bacterium]